MPLSRNADTQVQPRTLCTAKAAVGKQGLVVDVKKANDRSFDGAGVGKATGKGAGEIWMTPLPSPTIEAKKYDLVQGDFNASSEERKTIPGPRTVTAKVAQPVPAPPPHEKPYGTRTSTIILVRRDGSVTFIERDREWLDLREGGEGMARHGGRKERRFDFSVWD